MAQPRPLRRERSRKGGRGLSGRQFQGDAARRHHAEPGVRGLCRRSAPGPARRHHLRRPAVRPSPPTAMSVLTEAAAAPSLADYVHRSAWMHPSSTGSFARRLRAQICRRPRARMLQVNMQRVRALPSHQAEICPRQRRPAAAYMYENRQPVDLMVVVVGKPKWPTSKIRRTGTT